ncbi:MAG: hypothetical protein JW942_02275, partial [Opitutales bacterium]|nr:hypothetical protein [Opitutales bacterium]
PLTTLISAANGLWEGVNPPSLKGFALTATTFAYPKTVNDDAEASVVQGLSPAHPQILVLVTKPVVSAGLKRDLFASLHLPIQVDRLLHKGSIHFGRAIATNGRPQHRS